MPYNLLEMGYVVLSIRNGIEFLYFYNLSEVGFVRVLQL